MRRDFAPAVYLLASQRNDWVTALAGMTNAKIAPPGNAHDSQGSLAGLTTAEALSTDRDRHARQVREGGATA